MTRLYHYFGKGLIILVPIFITFFVLKETFQFTEGVLGSHFTYYFPGLGFIACLLFILLTGCLFSHWMLERLLGWGERVIDTIPIINFIYQSVKKLSEAVFDSKQLFNQAVLVPYSTPQTKVLGFIVQRDMSPIMGTDGKKYVCVFVPWSLNMTSGINLMVLEDEVIMIDVSGEEALQFVLTAGSVMPTAKFSAEQVDKQELEAKQDTAVNE